MRGDRERGERRGRGDLGEARGRGRTGRGEGEEGGGLSRTGPGLYFHFRSEKNIILSRLPNWSM